MTHDPFAEDEAAETRLIAEVCEIFNRMRSTQSMLPREHLEKYFRLQVRKELLHARRDQIMHTLTETGLQSGRKLLMYEMLTDLQRRENEAEFQLAKIRADDLERRK